MKDNAVMVQVRDGLHGLLSLAKIGIVVALAIEHNDFDVQALYGLRKILTSSGLGTSGHVIFLDQGMVRRRENFEVLASKLGLDGNAIHPEEDSVRIGGLQIADLVAHTCATLRRAEMGLMTKQVKAGNNSGYEPDLDLDLAFVLWVGLRWNFIAAPPPIETWTSQLDFQADVASRGLYIAETCSHELRSAALTRFGKSYLGCLH
jgi:hypothetical protein